MGSLDRGTLDLIQQTLSVGEGTNAGRPAAGTAGRLYRTTDNPMGLWKDTGSLWVPVGPLTVRKTADETVTNSTVLQNDDELLWSVAANEVWFFTLLLAMNAGNTTMDVKTGWAVPTLTTMIWGNRGATGNTAPGFNFTGTAVTPATLLTESGTQATGSAAATFGLGYEGYVVVGANAGTVNLQWAQNTADAGNLKVLINSTLLLWKLA